jgi:prevent-host-death family protein
MGKAVSAADANRDFSKLLRRVRDGGSFVITSHGTPVAKLIPVDGDTAVRNAAKRVLLERLRAQRGTRIGSWTRDELYDDL